MQSKRVHINLPKPHSTLQQEIIRLFCFDPDVREIWVSCGTKFGKTICASICMAQKLLAQPDRLLRWVAPTYAIATIGKRNVSRLLPPPPLVMPYQFSLRVPSSGSVLEIRSGDNPEHLEGEAAHAYVLDEASKLRPEVYASVKTTLTMTRGPILAISTPRGKNWFYQKCMEAKDDMEAALKAGRKPSRYFFTAPTSANPFISEEALRDMKLNLPDRLYRQYLLAEFTDEATVFLGFRDGITDPNPQPEVDEGGVYTWFHASAPKAQVVIGVDWAKTQDFTVFIALDITQHPFQMVGMKRFHKKKYTSAVKDLCAFSQRFGETLMVYHDKTGVGSALDDQLYYTDLPFEGITFTNSSKTNMVHELMHAFEHKLIAYPGIPELIKELERFETVTTASGLGMTFRAASGFHDDIVCSLMLAYKAAMVHDINANTQDFEHLFLDEKIAKVPTGGHALLRAFYDRAEDDEAF